MAKCVTEMHGTHVALVAQTWSKSWDYLWKCRGVPRNNDVFYQHPINYRETGMSFSAACAL